MRRPGTWLLVILALGILLLSRSERTDGKRFRKVYGMGSGVPRP